MSIDFSSLPFQLYVNGFVSAKNSYDNGDIAGAVCKTAKQVNTMPWVISDIKDTVDTFDKITNKTAGNKAFQTIIDTSKYDSIERWGLCGSKTNTKVDTSILGKQLSKSNAGQFFKNNIDLNLLEVAEKTSLGKKLVQASEKNLFARLCCKSLGRIPLLSLAVSAIPESIKIYQASKSGEGLEQAKKSAISLSSTAVCSAICGALMSPLLPPIGSLAGGVIGSYIGDGIAKRINGKPES